LVGDASITHEPDYFRQCQEKCDIRYNGVFSDDFVRNRMGKDGAEKTLIRMVGPATRGECVYWFSQAHCMVHPNQRFREPFGLAPVEAMACGCPVISWDNGAMRETVKDAHHRLVRSLDELIDKIKDHSYGYLHEAGQPTEREQCREWAGQFSIQNMVNRYEELCHEAVQTGGW
jgi:glycosyltransferase involved in cell wall biosynthesis